MNKLLTSASKLAFLAIAGTTCGAFLTGKMEAKDFMTLAAMAFSFYFANKGEASEPFAGK